MGNAARRNPLRFQRPALPVDLKDQLGRSLRPNDAVILPGISGSAIWRVADIRPVLDPGAPANVCALLLEAQLRFDQLTGQPVSGVVLIAPAEVPTPEEQVNGEEPARPAGDGADGPKVVLP